MPKSISFSNLHISPEGWFLAGHQSDGSMRQWDITRCDVQAREKIAGMLGDLICAPEAVLVYETEKGVQ